MSRNARTNTPSKAYHLEMPPRAREFKETTPGDKGDHWLFGEGDTSSYLLGHAHPDLLLAVFLLSTCSLSRIYLWTMQALADSLIPGNFQAFEWHSMGEKEGKKRSTFMPQKEETEIKKRVF